jgi:hypothetical protein
MTETLTLEPCSCAADNLPDPKLGLQIELEQLFNKNQLIPRIRKEFTDCKEIDFDKIFLDNKIPLPFGYDALVQMALHKRAKLPVLVGILRHHFEDSQLTVDMLQKMAQLDLLHWQPMTQSFVVQFTISADVQEQIDRYQFPLPMVIPPKPIVTNRDTGYVMSGGSVILKKNHHEDDVCLDHLNRVNAVRFAIDEHVATFVKNSWRNLDKPKMGESKEDFEKRKRAFEKYDRTSKEVIAKIISLGNEFYLTHKYDKRGRIYCQGYHINYQGAPWNKAVIQLADKELVDE